MPLEKAGPFCIDKITLAFKLKRSILGLFLQRLRFTKICNAIFFLLGEFFAA
jgi:hypothetical protein